MKKTKNSVFVYFSENNCESVEVVWFNGDVTMVGKNEVKIEKDGVEVRLRLSGNICAIFDYVYAYRNENISESYGEFRFKTKDFKYFVDSSGHPNEKAYHSFIVRKVLNDGKFIGQE